MKRQLFAVTFLLSTMMATRAALFIQGTTGQGVANAGSILNATIMDGNPASLTVNSMDLTTAGLGWSVSSLTVTLNISGGMNNGLYGYLVAPNGVSVVLLNQPGVAVDGFGATGAGMNVTLSDAGSSSIQNVLGGSTLSGTYAADSSLAGYNGVNPNGAWTLYFSDTIAGGGNATLNGWSLDITAVPEPVNTALAVFGGGGGLLALVRCIRARKSFIARD